MSTWSDSTWLDGIHPLHNHFKHFYTKSHSFDSTVLKVKSHPLVATRHDLTTFYTPLYNHFKHFYTKYHSFNSNVPEVESCRLVATRHDLTTFYTPPPQPLQALLYKVSFFQLDFSKCWVMSTQHDLTTFYTPPTQPPQALLYYL